MWPLCRLAQPALSDENSTTTINTSTAITRLEHQANIVVSRHRLSLHNSAFVHTAVLLCFTHHLHIPLLAKIPAPSLFFLLLTHQEFTSSLFSRTKHRKHQNKQINKPVRVILLSFQYLYPIPVRSNCRQAITAKPWDEAYLIQINYLKNVRSTIFTRAIKRLKTKHILWPDHGETWTHYQRFQKSYRTPDNPQLKCDIPSVRRSC